MRQALDRAAFNIFHAAHVRRRNCRRPLLTSVKLARMRRREEERRCEKVQGSNSFGFVLSELGHRFVEPKVCVVFVVQLILLFTPSQNCSVAKTRFSSTCPPSKIQSSSSWPLSTFSTSVLAISSGRGVSEAPATRCILILTPPRCSSFTEHPRTRPSPHQRGT